MENGHENIAQLANAIGTSRAGRSGMRNANYIVNQELMNLNDQLDTCRAQLQNATSDRHVSRRSAGYNSYPNGGRSQNNIRTNTFGDYDSYSSNQFNQQPYNSNQNQFISNDQFRVAGGFCLEVRPIIGNQIITCVRFASVEEYVIEKARFQDYRNNIINPPGYWRNRFGQYYMAGGVQIIECTCDQQKHAMCLTTADDGDRGLIPGGNAFYDCVIISE